MCFLGVTDLHGWKIKTYGVALGPRPRAELAIIEHERRALLRHVLESPSGPDLDGYLADALR